MLPAAQEPPWGHGPLFHRPRLSCRNTAGRSKAITLLLPMCRGFSDGMQPGEGGGVGWGRREQHKSVGQKNIIHSQTGLVHWLRESKSTFTSQDLRNLRVGFPSTFAETVDQTQTHVGTSPSSSEATVEPIPNNNVSFAFTRQYFMTLRHCRNDPAQNTEAGVSSLESDIS